MGSSLRVDWPHNMKVSHPDANYPPKRTNSMSVSPNDPRPTIKHQCKACGKEFAVLRFWANSKTARFCSVPCRDAYKRHPAQSFWPRVNKEGSIPPHCPELGPCWVWTGGKTRHGYGKTGTRNGTHRISWEIHNGPIPDGLHVLHRCDNPPCVNPSHLFLGNHADNVRDMASKGRQRGPRGDTHGWAKITEEQAREILLRKELGQGLTEICEALGLPKTTVSNIYRGTSWKWLSRKHP